MREGGCVLVVLVMVCYLCFGVPLFSLQAKRIVCVVR